MNYHYPLTAALLGAAMVGSIGCRKPAESMSPVTAPPARATGSSPSHDDEYKQILGLKLSSGRKVTLNSLKQSRTNLGLLVGIPSPDTSTSIILGALERAEHDSHPPSKPVLIPPARRDFYRTPGDARRPGGPDRDDRPVEWLPTITCIAEFESVEPAQDKSKDASILTVVWFQDDWALPIPPSILEAIQKLDWEKLATGFAY